MRRLAAVITLLFVTIGAAAAEPLERAVDKLAAETMSRWLLPGLAVAVVENDRVVYMKGFGVRELGKPDPVTTDTLFEIASTTKAFTTTALAMLVDRKTLDWDDPVRKHVEYFHLDDPCADSLVTVRDIVSHRTGLSRHDELWDYTDWPREQIIRSVASMKLSKPFRSTYQYQNIMFALAGEVVAAAAKMPWEQFVRSNIFEPIGMTSTRVSLADWNALPHASGHRFERAANRMVVQPMTDYGAIAPAGTIKSTIHDMAQWVRFQLAGGVIDGRRLISAEALEETHIPQTLIRLEGTTREVNPETNMQAYALGWVVQDYRGELLLAHAGALNSFRTQVVLVPKRNTGLVLMTNASRGYALFALRNALVDRLLGGSRRDWNAYFLDLEKKFVEKAEQEKTAREAKRHRDTKPSRELEAYAGTYENPAYRTAMVTKENGGLVLQWNRLRAPLTHVHFDIFSASIPEDEFEAQVQFGLGIDGEVKTMTVFGEEFGRK